MKKCTFSLSKPASSKAENASADNTSAHCGHDKIIALAHPQGHSRSTTSRHKGIQSKHYLVTVVSSSIATCTLSTKQMRR
jgi:hypothetical protein